MNAHEKYHNWLEGYLRETIDTALEKAFTVHKIRKQKMLEDFYELSEAIDLLDKDSSPEHHDVIVEKGDQGII